MDFLTARPVSMDAEPLEGWKRLGSGGDKTGYLAPDRKSVVLVMKDNGRLQVPLAWYSFARQHPSPHIIRVLDGPVDAEVEGAPAKMVRVEPLTPIKHPFILNLHRGLYQEFYGKSARQSGLLLEKERDGKFLKLTRPVLSEFPSYVAVLIQCLKGAPGSAKFDAHSRNVMARKGIPVIIDPWIG